MQESMPKIETTPAPEALQKPEAVMEKFGKEREGILTRFVDRAIGKFDEIVPEVLNKPIKSAVKSSVVGHVRMSMQAYKGVNEEGRQLTRAERLARILNTFTWAAGYIVSIYSARHGDLETAAAVQAMSTASVMPINAFLNNEKELDTILAKLKARIPLLHKISELSQKQPELTPAH